MITIQKAQPKHIDILIDFQQRLAYESEGIKLDGSTLKKGMDALFADPGKGHYYVAMDGDDVVGCHSITYEWSDWRNGMCWWIQSVYVRESHRQKGIFKMMYDNLVSMINKDPNIIGLRLYVDKSNERAMKVYAAMGMNGAHYTVYEWIK